MGITLVLQVPDALAQANGASEPQGVTASMDDIVVTARRREESIQKVPVSVTAYSNETLRSQQVLQMRDLTFSTPGLVFTSSGSAQNVVVTIRGQTKQLTGAGVPSIITYLNDVPLQDRGSSIPTFDMSSIQVLKGPQGTYFGRNTIGGAILSYTTPPAYNLSGYASAIVGSYNWFETEGALNVPIIDNKVAARIAFNTVDRDGYSKNLGTIGGDLDDRNSWAIRASLRVEPVDWFSNSTVFDLFKAHENGVSNTILGAAPVGPARLAALAPVFDCGTSPACDVDLAVARQKAEGPYSFRTDIDPFSRVRTWGISNTTTIDLGAVRIKNVFGLRHNHIALDVNSDNWEAALINAIDRRNAAQTTNELQFSGDLMNDELSWLAGAFYLTTKPLGIDGQGLEAFMPSRAAAATRSFFTHAYYRDRAVSVFGQLTYDLSDLIDGLKINGGYRQSWNRQKVCSTANLIGQPRIDEDACRGLATAFQATVKSKSPNWSIGLDYQATSDVFLYLTARQGTRGGGINAPRLGGVLADYQGFSPDRLRDVEVGAKTQWSLGELSGRLNMAAFRGKFSNIQRQISGIPPNADGDDNPANDPASSSLTINSGKARIQGIDFDLALRPFDNLTISANGTYTDAKYTSFDIPAFFAGLGVAGGTPIFVLTPKFTSNLGIEYDVPIGGNGTSLHVNANWYHSGSLYYGQIYQTSYDLVNARIDLHDVLYQGLDIGLFARNLTKANYVAGGALSSVGSTLLTGIYGAPRMFGVQLRYAFGE